MGPRRTIGAVKGTGKDRSWAHGVLRELVPSHDRANRHGSSSRRGKEKGSRNVS
jgi:hypothetical protein